MTIKTFKAKNFKIHEEISLNFDNGGFSNRDETENKMENETVLKSIVIGKNSIGKTSIIEAISMFSGINCFSICNDKNKDLINFNSCIDKDSIASVEIETDYLSKFRLEITNRRRSYFVNNKKILSLKDFNNLPKILTISPILQYNFLSKEGKREMFENLISNLDLKYLKYKQDYIKLCQKRNILTNEGNNKLLSIIEKQITDIGIELLKIRQNIHLHSSNSNISFSKKEPIVDLFMELFTKDINSNLDELNDFSRQKLEENRLIDFKAKRMFYSFVRFEFDISLKGISYNFLSNSEQKQCIYEYIISNIEIIASKTDKKIILLIDEIDSFFDRDKMLNTLERLNNKNILQIIATSPNLIEESYFKDFSIFHIKED